MLADLAWPDVEARAGSSVLALPVGSTEQHGPHLPLSTDTDIAVALSVRLAEHLGEVVVAPAVPYGSSGEHAGFAGTLSIGQDALEHLLVELVRSADAFAGVLIVSAHGGNAAPVGRAVARLVDEGRRAAAWSPSSADPCDSHAGRDETSVLMALGSPALRRERVAAGELRPLAELMPSLRSGGVAAVSESGVLGDPSAASVEHGMALLESWASDLVEAVRRL
jgi:mycofactocin system creatininase family protein